MVLRLAWRAANPTPTLPADSARWTRIAAGISHAALYLITILVAILGGAHSGAHAPDYSSFSGWFHVPQFTLPDREAVRACEDRHILFAYVLLALIVIHVAATAWHHYVRRDRVATRVMTGEAGTAIPTAKTPAPPRSAPQPSAREDRPRACGRD